MLERIRLTNFQCHVKLKIALGKSILAIIGDSDVGKSSICRALRWLALNKPRGSGFIRWGEKDCSVKVRIDGVDIERVKDSNGNRYIVNGKEYKAIGYDVPPDVASLLALGPENFQQQHDSPFWFNLTPGELGKELNKIVDMEIIDKALAEVASRLRKEKSVGDVCEQRLAQAKDRTKELEWVPGFVEELDVVVGLEKVATTATDNLLNLRADLLEIEEFRESVESSQDYVEAGQAVLKKGKVFESSKRRWSKLRKLVESALNQQKFVEDARDSRNKCKRLLAKESAGRCPICGGTISSKNLTKES